MKNYDYRRNLIISAYRINLKREPSEEELEFHYNSDVSNAFIALHVRNSEEAKMIRKAEGKKRTCCGR